VCRRGRSQVSPSHKAHSPLIFLPRQLHSQQGNVSKEQLDLCSSWRSLLRTHFLDLDFCHGGIKVVNMGSKLHRMGSHAEVNSSGGRGFNGRRHGPAPDGGLRVGCPVVVPHEPPPSSPRIFFPIQLFDLMSWCYCKLRLQKKKRDSPSRKLAR